MLLREWRVQSVKSVGKDRVAGNVSSPIIESHTPRIGVRIIAERDQSVRARAERKPSAVPSTDGTVRRLDLAVVENRFTEEQVTVRSPDYVVQCVVRVLAAEAG